MEHLGEFLSARLQDLASARPALRACCTLVERGASGAGAPSLKLEIIERILRMLGSDVAVPALAQAARTAALQLLLAAVRGYGARLKDAGLNLVDVVSGCIDGEKDPRCLLEAFQLSKATCSLYPSSAKDLDEGMSESFGDLFDVLACYFPLSFTPPRDDRFRISREDLAAGLQDALAHLPQAAQFVLPLVVEKLTAPLDNARRDAASLLAACAATYPPADMEPFVGAAWAALRSEMSLPDADAGGQGGGPALTLRRRGAAVTLRECVARGWAALGRAAAADARLFAQMTDVVTRAGEFQYDDDRKAEERLRPAMLAARALAGSTAECARAVAEPVVQRLAAPMSSLWEAVARGELGAKLSSLGDGMTAVAAVLRGLSELPPSALQGADGTTTTHPLASVAAAAVQALSGASGDVDDAGGLHHLSGGGSGRTAALATALRGLSWIMRCPSDSADARVAVQAAVTIARAGTRATCALPAPDERCEHELLDALQAVSQRCSCDDAVLHAVRERCLPDLVAGAPTPLQLAATASLARHCTVLLGPVLRAHDAVLTKSMREPGAGEVPRVADDIRRRLLGPHLTSADGPALQDALGAFLEGLAGAARDADAAPEPPAPAACVSLAALCCRAMQLLPASAQLPLLATASVPDDGQPTPLCTCRAAGLIAGARGDALASDVPAALALARAMLGTVSAVVRGGVRAGHERAAVATCAAEAAGSVLNKLGRDAAARDAVDAVVAEAERMVGAMLGSTDHEGDVDMEHGRCAAAEIVGTFAGALAMLPHKRSAALLGLLVDNVRSVGESRGLSDELAAAAWAVAAPLRRAEDAGDGSLLTADAHCRQHPLWQARCTAVCLGLLSQARDAAGGAPRAVHAGLAMAGAAVAAAAPPGAAAQDAAVAVSVVVDTLHFLSEPDALPALGCHPPCANDPASLRSAQAPAAQACVGAVRAFGALAADPVSSAALQDAAPRGVEALARLVQSAPVAAVREAAARGLRGAAERVAYTALHAGRRDVVRALEAARDDGRRAVRVAAARALEAWRR
ncbi:unnamed protein product [Pedinophyceae sp. YPF-701]|nr:unnamed protein product [Pedinophyceae sp. YPF-701]